MALHFRKARQHTINSTEQIKYLDYYKLLGTVEKEKKNRTE